ncbi:hypothetical protein NADFUDRAFT_13590, partial [Nadsonia fulvescens var. elongata DSM 6958]
ILSARVKSVLSADTLVLTPLSSSTERVLHLAFLDAPRLATNDKYAFESREALRSLLVGKTIKFKVLYSLNGREYGDVSAPIFDSLVARILADGTAKLRTDAPANATTDDLAALLDTWTPLEKRAKSDAVGIWADKLPPSPVILTTLDTALYADPAKPYSAIVERVVAGDRLQVRIMLSSADAPQGRRTHILTPALIAGVKTPRSASPDTPAEPYGEPAKLFVSDRLLQRSVKVCLIDTAASGLPIVTIAHPAGDIAQLLLSNGLASVADWQSSALGAATMSTLRAAEKAARLAHLNLWKNTSTAIRSDATDFDATVAKIVSPDTLVVRNLQTDQETTVQLASVRGPRLNDKATAPYVPVAKEFLRTKLIGKRVKVHVHTIRPATDHFEQRSIVTLTNANDFNVAALLVDQGLATVIRHRATDEDRSDIWDLLLEKESYAIKGHRGVHSKKPPTAGDDDLVNASENATKAKIYLPSLQRQSTIPAVVEHVASAGRLRLRVANGKDNISLTLVLSGVRAPRSEEAYGEKARDFVLRRYLQRDVTFTVLGLDKTGGFIGHVFLPGSGTKTPLSLSLVSEGLASVHGFSAENSGYYDQLMAAQESAQNEEKNLWEGFKAQQQQAKAKEEDLAKAHAKAEAQAQAPTKQYLDIKITDIADSGSVSYIPVSAASTLTRLQADLASFYAAAANATVATFQATGTTPHKNEYVAYRDPDSNVFNRGKVMAVDRAAGTYNVNLIDVGTTIPAAPLDHLRPLKDDPKWQPSAVKPLAQVAALSFIKLPPSSPTDYLAEYVDCLKGTILGKQMVGVLDGKVAGVSNSVDSLTLFQIDSAGPEDSVNAFLVDEAYAFVKPDKALAQAWEKSSTKALQYLRELQEGARSSRVGVWEYGDADD